ncbi:MAG: hypothetical protein IKR82_01185 [Bacteroidales bacterium]|nr:hypothetical protein [Bacteroidales bacterium]
MIRAVFVGKLNGQVVIVEVKSSATAPLTQNQSIVYPKMEVGETILHVGSKASNLFKQQTINNYDFQIWRGIGGAFKP